MSIGPWILLPLVLALVWLTDRALKSTRWAQRFWLTRPLPRGWPGVARKGLILFFFALYVMAVQGLHPWR